MSFIPKKPEKAVQVLLARITKAKDQVKRALKRDCDELSHKFKNIESKLQLMTESMSKINNWEKQLLSQLCTLDEVLHEGIFTFEDADLNISLTSDKLAGIDSNLAILTELVSAAEQEQQQQPPVNLKTDMNSIGGRQPGEWGGVKLGIESKIMESKAMARLRLSFDRLECHRLRMCLLSLSVFPENTPIKKRPLIYWWMGEGIIVEDKEGDQVFQRILDEGFMRRPTATSANSFVFNPWVRRMLIQLAYKNGFLESSSAKRRAFDIRHKEEPAAEALTVFNIKQEYLRTEKQWLSRLHKVEVLQMGRWQDSINHHIEAENYTALLEGLGSQKHLKYLSLRGISRIETLPSTIGKLVSLRILDLKACHNLGRIPRTISQLSQLTHLDMSECFLMESIPKGVKQLLNLKVLKGFVVSSEGCSIAHLAPLLHLRKLSVKVRNNGCHQLESLVELKDLHNLTISWMGMVDDKLVDLVKLPISLRKLGLRSVPFEGVQEWMTPEKLPCLEKLYIIGGKLKHDAIKKSDYPNLIDYPRLHYLGPHIIKQQEYT